MTVTIVFMLGALFGVLMAIFAVLIGEYIGKRLTKKEMERFNKELEEWKKSEGITK